MKNFLICFLALALPSMMSAQSEEQVVTTKKLKVVFHLTSNDTLVQKAMVKQLHHFLIAAPNAQIEVVCHSNGISFLQSAVTRQSEKISELKSQGVVFVACENTMRERKIKKEDLVPECGTVPSGIVEVALKQDKGWSYIKPGL